jgi:hypothetical protein
VWPGGQPGGEERDQQEEQSSAEKRSGIGGAHVDQNGGYQTCGCQHDADSGNNTRDRQQHALPQQHAYDCGRPRSYRHPNSDFRSTASDGASHDPSEK